MSHTQFKPATAGKVRALRPRRSTQAAIRRPASSPDAIARTHAFYADPTNRVEIQFPIKQNQFTWQNMSRFYPTAQILRAGPVHHFPRRPDLSIAGLRIDIDGQNVSLKQHLDSKPVDAFLVVQNGEILFERYNSMRPIDKHNWFSNSKVTTGILLAMLIDEGSINPDHKVSRYLPQLLGSVWDTVTVQQTADMATGLDATEHDEPQQDSRTNPEQGWYRWAASVDVMHNDETASPLEVIASMQRRGPGHQKFEYNSINTFVLGRIIEQVTQRSLSDLFSERVWQRIGASADAYVAVSREQGYPLHFFSMNSNLEDMARFGMILTPSARKLPGGKFVADSVLSRIQRSGDASAYDKGYVGQKFLHSFAGETGLKNGYQWDAIFPDGDLFKAGVGGQGLYVSPGKDLVVAWFGTGDGNNQEESFARAIARHLDH